MELKEKLYFTKMIIVIIKIRATLAKMIKVK